MTTEKGGVATRLPDRQELSAECPVVDEELPLQRIYRNERENAARIFFTQPGGGTVREWSWQAAIGETRRMANYLRAQHWPPESRIVILSKNCAWWIMADFAIWMAGHVSVPIFASLGDSALANLLEHCQPVACFVGPLDRSPAIEGTPLALHRIALPAAPPCSAAATWEKVIKEAEPIGDNPVRGALETATIFYTSGTTGEPKGVMQTFQSLALMAKSILPALDGGDYSDQILSYLPLAHIAERAIVEMTSLYLPVHIYFVENQESFLRDLKSAHPTIFFTVPRLLTRFRQGVLEKIPEKRLSLLQRLPVVHKLVGKRILKALALDGVRLAASGSAPLALDLLQWYRKLGLNLVEGYGMTETGITHVPLPGKTRAGYVGNASEYADTRISSEGEIQIKGPMNLAGYYRNPSLTEASFTADRYFRTGDRGEIDDQGRLRIVGRLKEEFKTSKGKYVVPGPIEEALNANGLFDSVCVLGSGMAAPFALAVLTAERRALAGTPGGRAAVESELGRELTRVNERLEPYERLRFLAVAADPWTIENGFLTPTLKVRRARVEERFLALFDTLQNSGKTMLWLEP